MHPSSEPTLLTSRDRRDPGVASPICLRDSAATPLLVCSPSVSSFSAWRGQSACRPLVWFPGRQGHLGQGGGGPGHLAQHSLARHRGLHTCPALSPAPALPHSPVLHAPSLLFHPQVPSLRMHRCSLTQCLENGRVVQAADKGPTLCHAMSSV